MDRWSKWGQFVAQCVVLGLAAAFVLSRLFPERFGTVPVAPPVPPAPTAAPVDSYAPLVRQVLPTVVNIYTRRIITEQPFRVMSDPMLQRYSGITMMPAQRRQEAILGSGVIVSSDGFVLTNHHVIANADDILVGLSDGRITSARLVGSDPDTDIAVLKMEASGLPAAKFPAKGATPAVGDVVLSIGNAFGQGQTVTQGIVSATARNQSSLSRFEDFIQTDAAINLGNSGGALIDTHGVLVGINTAVTGKGSGTGSGIGFAIPATTAARVLAEIVAHGRVIRGWIGAEYVDAQPGALSPGQVGPRGVEILTIAPGSPAALAGLQPRDVLQRFADVDIVDASDLRNRESETRPGTEVKIEGLRTGIPFNVVLTLIERGTGGG